MKKVRRTSPARLARQLSIPKGRGMEASTLNFQGIGVSGTLAERVARPSRPPRWKKDPALLAWLDSL